MAVTVFAPAKINLALHVTGQRSDGYHLLESLVAFADMGDRVTVATADRSGFTVTGPFAKQVPDGNDNLVLRAARLFTAHDGVSITLEKNLPVASGMGGGSSDAAACLKGLADLRRVALPDSAAVLALGADVPVCLFGQTAMMRGIGEQMSPVLMPPLPAVLVNPGVPVATAGVFRGLAHKDNAAMTAPPVTAAVADWLLWLTTCRNDLEAPASRLEPVIERVLSELRRLGPCRLARMTGSGATCFGLFETLGAARSAAAALKTAHPDWWVQPAMLG